VKVFATFAARECDIFEPLTGPSNPRKIYYSVVLSHKVRVGRISLVDFIRLVQFEVDRATLWGFTEACTTSAQKEIEYRKSDAYTMFLRALELCTLEKQMVL
jgi:hypothetical protein